MDANDLLATRFKTIFIELLHLDVLPLFIVDMLRLAEALLLQCNAFFLQILELVDHLVDFSPLNWSQLAHVHIWMLAFQDLPS